MREVGMVSGCLTAIGNISGVFTSHSAADQEIFPQSLCCRRPGTRQMVTAFQQKQRKGYAAGLISMCIGGGIGIAIER